jgi:hypothetical protein
MLYNVLLLRADSYVVTRGPFSLFEMENSVRGNQKQSSISSTPGSEKVSMPGLSLTR